MASFHNGGGFHVGIPDPHGMGQQPLYQLRRVGYSMGASDQTAVRWYNFHHLFLVRKMETQKSLAFFSRTSIGDIPFNNCFTDMQ